MLQRLETVTCMNLNQPEAIKTSVNMEIDSVKYQLIQTSSQLSAQMEKKILKCLQTLGGNQVNSNGSGGSNHQYNQLNQNHDTGEQRYNFGRLTKIEFPKFNGTNVEGWLCRVEHFFLY
ncbi:hypothetical protein HanRHA438_Chr01g0006421 [Helianthus annuus]|nr:hypothetical protein HanRHA438_Chr01g0006421 [Helianthus annuus]